MSADPNRVANPGTQPYCAVDAAALAADRELDAVSRRLAPLFDGHSSAEQRLQAGRRIDPTLTASTLRDAALELSFAGLLMPGRIESLPSPHQLDRDPWGGSAHYGYARSVEVTSLLPGNMATAGLPGAIAGALGGSYRGGESEIDIRLPPRAFGAIGRWFAAPAATQGTSIALMLLVVIGLIAFWNTRLSVAENVRQVGSMSNFVLIALIASAMVNLAAQSARLWVIRRSTGEWPRFGLNFAMHLIPRLFTDTAGAAERATHAVRSQILAAPLIARLLLCFLGELGWFLTRHGSSVLPQFCIGLAGVALVSFLYNANPLARRDGYYWLSNRLGVPDLREQGWLLLARWDRPWNEGPLVSRRVRYTYAALAIAYLVAVIVLYLLFPARWMERVYGGAGVVVFGVSLALSIYQQSRRGLDSRISMEPLSVKLLSILNYPKSWSRTTWIVIGVVALLFFMPYPYEPSGAAVLLPRDRAEVRALVAGDVKQVLVQEGDMVQAGQELMQISDVQSQAEVAAAEATLRRAQAELSIVKTGGASGEVQLAREKLETARRRQQFAQAEADRLANAFKRKAVSPQEYDTARGAAAVRRQEVIEAEQQVKVIVNPARDERVAALQAEVLKAETELTYHKEQLANTHVRAPIAGRVVSDRLLFAKGAYLPVGAPIAFIEDATQLQAEIELPESAMGKVALDSRAWVRVWAFPGSSFSGKVTHIAPDAEKGDYGKIVRVRMLLDDSNSQLKPEMTGQGKVRSHWTLAGFAFTRALVRFAMIEVWSWLP
ncbi:HlyD family secretion protein [Hydrocarboniphaga sp.]|uniref:HlyD family secretion protein n=1 Tax=Hydrocarboniphaga sp. TaxID=2033016 RepID=UPI003D0A87E6